MEAFVDQLQLVLTVVVIFYISTRIYQAVYNGLQSTAQNRQAAQTVSELPVRRRGHNAARGLFRRKKGGK